MEGPGRHSRAASSSEDSDHLDHLLAPTEAEQRAGIRGLRVEQDDETPEQRRRRKSKQRNILVTATVLFVVALVVSLSIILPRTGIFETKDYDGSGNGTRVEVTVSNGDGTYAVAQKLQAQGVVANADYFVEEFDDRSSDKKTSIQPGKYQLEKEMSSDSALDKMLGSSDENYVAINQASRKSETFAALSKATGVSVSDFEAEDQNLSEYGIPSKFPNLEGWLHPGEYRFPKKATARDIIHKMVDRTKDDLAEDGVHGDDQVFHVLTVASIIEFESVPKDYARVAGAVENRMDNPDGETSGYIQSDATVAYGLGKTTVQLTEDEKKDQSNKYSTYAHKGLPAGPIGSPGSEGIKAAAHPEKNDYYFWVTVNLDTGETKFAKTLEEHEKNIEQYDQWCSDHEGKCV